MTGEINIVRLSNRETYLCCEGDKIHEFPVNKVKMLYAVLYWISPDK